MTPNIPAGRELDRRVAEVLWPGGDLDHHDHPWRRCRYSTEFGPWTQEMLDWLAVNHALGHEATTTIEVDDDTGGTTVDFRDCTGDRDIKVHTLGRIPEALARLVLDVKEAKDH